MNAFEEFCAEKQIRGNFKEALYHTCAAEYGLERIDILTRDEVAVCWNKVLQRMLVDLLNK